MTYYNKLPHCCYMGSSMRNRMSSYGSTGSIGKHRSAKNIFAVSKTGKNNIRYSEIRSIGQSSMTGNSGK